MISSGDELTQGYGHISSKISCADIEPQCEVVSGWHSIQLWCLQVELWGGLSRKTVEDPGLNDGGFTKER